MTELYKDKETLYHFYYQLEMSLREMGELFGVTRTAIVIWMKKYNMPRRSNRGHTEKVKRKISKAHKGKTRNKETKKKISETLTGKYTGEDNPTWNGGRSDSYGQDWYSQRRKALRCDNYTCQVCDKDNNFAKKHPVVHHINAELDEEGYKNNNLDNLITMCKECHNRTENNKWLDEVV